MMNNNFQTIIEKFSLCNYNLMGTSYYKGLILGLLI